MKISTDTGKLNQRIIIQKQGSFTDEIGNNKTELTDFYKCWASVTGVSGREYWAAREQHEENTLSCDILPPPMLRIEAGASRSIAPMC